MFAYRVKTLFVLSATGGDVSVASIVNAIGVPIGITSASLSLLFSFSNYFAKKNVKDNKKKGKSFTLKWFYK